MSRSTVVLGDETTRVDELSHLGKKDTSERRDNFSAYKNFGSPNWDKSWHSECHEMRRLRV